MKRQLIAILSALSTTTFAVTPLPTKGIQLVPLAQMELPSDFKKQILARKKEEKERGFYEEDSEETHALLAIKNDAAKEIKAYAGTPDKYDTHLKKSFNDIKLAFIYKPSPAITNVMGYVPAGSYITDKGWSGIVVFFEDKTVGVCSYSYFDLKVANGAVQLNKDTTEYLVNKKPSSRSVFGSRFSGFSYVVNWFTDSTMAKLECANRKYDATTIGNVIKLANAIDDNGNKS